MPANLPIQFLHHHLHDTSLEKSHQQLCKAHRLLDALDDLVNGTSHGHQWDTVLERSLTILHDSMRHADSPSVLNLLRIVFTDCCILLAVLHNSAARPLDAIAVLDKSIIVAGPSGPGRFEIVHSLIRTSQEALSTGAPDSLQCLARPPPGQGTPCTVLCLPSPPSMIAFQNQYSKTPFIIRKFARSWPALNEHPWSSTAYLNSVAGPGRIVPVEVGRDYRDDHWTQVFMEWDTLLSKLSEERETRESTPHQTLYLAQYDLARQFPRLRDDIDVPDYVYACLEPDYPQYRPPQNEDGLVINMWLGKDTMSPAHTDPYHNLYFQVVGQKQVWLAPPSASDSIYCASAPAGSREGISNTSNVDVFSEDLKGLQTKFPKFVSDVMPLATSATLEPGDMLYFPPGWWHAMQTRGTSFSVSMWF